MTVRSKITVLITAAGVVASLVFSCIILLEMMEQPFRLIDADLESTGQRVVQAVAAGGIEEAVPSSMNDSHYWLEVNDLESGSVVYRSRLARLFRIPAPSSHGRAEIVSVAVPSQVALGQGEHGEVPVRVMSSTFPIAGKQYMVTIGRPIEHLAEELKDTVIGVVGGLVFSLLLLAGISYFLAGFMLRPIREIDARVRDISEKHLDKRLPTTGDRDEFNQLAETLNKVFDRLQNAFWRQKRLLADASHELKTPLTMMRLELDDIRSTTNENCHDPQAQTHARMTEQVLRMDRLVKGLLDLSALEIDASATKAKLDIVPVLSSLIDDYRMLAGVRGIYIHADLPDRLEMEGDEEKLTRALSNLLDNAIKYNMDGGSVTVVGEQAGNRLTIAVGNTGPGVPEADIPRIFEQFYRVEKSRSQRHGGSGLGLAIVKRIVELHGGTVTFESSSGEQTMVTVILPRQNHKPAVDSCAV